MYKDPDRQREANRQASQRRRDKGMTQGMTNEGMMPQGMTDANKPHKLNLMADVINGQVLGKPERTEKGNI